MIITQTSFHRFLAEQASSGLWENVILTKPHTYHRWRQFMFAVHWCRNRGNRGEFLFSPPVIISHKTYIENWLRWTVKKLLCKAIAYGFSSTIDNFILQFLSFANHPLIPRRFAMHHDMFTQDRFYCSIK